MEMKELYELLKDIDKIVEDITTPETFLAMYPHQLSEVEVRLAGLRGSLAEWVAHADTAYYKQQAYTEHYRAKKFMEKRATDLKAKQGEIAMAVEAEIWEVREKEFDAMKMAKHLKLRHASYESVINAIKDRIKVLQGERFEKT